MPRAGARLDSSEQRSVGTEPLFRFRRRALSGGRILVAIVNWKQSNGFSRGVTMEPISRGNVNLLYFTVRRDDFANLEPQPPYRYFLVTQVFTAGGEYLCTQLLGIDLRAVKDLATPGSQHMA